MLARAIALSLALLVGIGVLVPLATDIAEAGPRAKKKSKQRKQAKKYKKYSRAWWRQYNARKKKARTLQAKKRQLRLRQIRLQTAANDPKAEPVARPTRTRAAAPVADAAPKGWKPAQQAPAEVQFRVDNTSGDQVGSASISVVGPAVGQSVTTGSQRSIGGVPVTSLRREVIDKMIRENGWVVNDYQKEIGGQQVYVVEAQSQARNGRVQSRMFYFTEVDGRIYNVATNSAADQTTKLAEESEKVINSLKSRVRPALRASN